MITLQRSDPTISALIGENKGVRHGDAVRPSQFALALNLGTRKVIFNTLTKQCIESKYYEWFASPEELSFDERDIEMSLLLKRDFLVATGLNEAERYANLIKTVRAIEKPKEGYTGYTILPTTACNARCIYCFEQGVAFETMTDEVVDQTIRYINATRREGETLRLHWFGGEPLMGEQIIDKICAALREAKVSYTSDIITNGSLMNSDLARKAKEDWHLNRVQITLDGREETYCEIKRYVAFSGSPFKSVIEGIHALLNQDISVRIRLNVDDGNIEELMSLTDDLEEEFREEGLINIYCHSIFAEKGRELQNEDIFYERMMALNERLYVFNQERGKQRQKSIIRKTADESKAPYDRKGFLKRYYCMVDNPATGGVILPNGDICLCEHIGEIPVASTVFDTTPLLRSNYIKQGREKSAKCALCAMLPICADQMNCPTKSRDCYKEELSIEMSKLRSLEHEKRLPPINISIGSRVIRVSEPTAEFIEKNNSLITDDYLKEDETLTTEQAESLILEFANNREPQAVREERMHKWAVIEKNLAAENKVLDPPEYLVLEDKKLAYLVNSKAACSSIKASMIGTETDDNYSVHILAERLNLIHDGLEKPGDYYVFTFVRNPFERMVSCYESKYHADIRSGKKTTNDFNDYLDGYLKEDRGFAAFVDKVCDIPWRLMDRHIKPQYNLIYDEEGGCRCNYVGKFENINEEYKSIKERYALKALPHFNASFGADWRKYYTPDSARKIYEKYRQDFETFGYEKSYEELLEFLTTLA